MGFYGLIWALISILILQYPVLEYFIQSSAHFGRLSTVYCTTDYTITVSFLLPTCRSALYYCEMDDDEVPEDQKTKFNSIPASCWWAVVTVTTLGYGDMYPETPLGKVLGTFCVFSGILVIAFQMPIMVAKVS